MPARAVAMLILALAASSLIAADASAAHPPKKKGEVRKILRDCAKDGDLDRRYSLWGLKRALRVMGDDLRDYTDCEHVIKRAIKKAVWRKLRPEVKKIYRDCARDDDLDRRYSLPALKLALKRLPDDLDDYTGCRKAIKRAIKKAHPPKHDGKKHHGHRTAVARLRTT
jgi:hypothetical protein